MTENNTTMNNQAVAFKHFTLNDIIEYLEKRNPDEEMVYSLTFDALSRVGEIKLFDKLKSDDILIECVNITKAPVTSVSATMLWYKRQEKKALSELIHLYS